MSGLVKVVFPLGEGSWHGNATERLWAEPMGNNRYRVRNTPFFVYDISAEDIVLCTEHDEEIIFERIVIRGGHSTYRIKLLRDKNLKAGPFIQAWTPLEKIGCSYEEGPLLAVDVPPVADIYVTYRLLEAGSDAGVWDFDEGHCGHPLRDDQSAT